MIFSRMRENVYFWVHGHSFVPLLWKENFVSLLIIFYLNTGILMDSFNCLNQCSWHSHFDVYYGYATLAWFVEKLCLKPAISTFSRELWLITPQSSGLEGYCRHGPGGRAGGLVGGRAGGCQTCGTHISVTAWWIFSVRSSMELPRPVVVHCHAHLPICSIWACPWAKNLSNLPQIGSRLCGSHISETDGWIYPI